MCCLAASICGAEFLEVFSSRGELLAQLVNFRVGIGAAAALRLNSCGNKLSPSPARA